MRDDRDKPYTATVLAAAGTTSLPLIIPGWATELALMAVPGAGGSLLVEHTHDDPDDVEANPNNAEWVNWEPGAVTVNTSRATSGRVSAIRVTATVAAGEARVSATRARST